MGLLSNQKSVISSSAAKRFVELDGHSICSGKVVLAKLLFIGKFPMEPMEAYENSSQETQMKTSMLSFNFLRNSHASSSTSIYARMPIVNSMNSIHKAVSVVQRFPLAIRQNWIPRLYFGFLLPGLETIER